MIDGEGICGALDQTRYPLSKEMPLPVSLDPPASVEPFWRETLHVLRQHPAFARYMGGTGISLVGTWMQVAAQGYVVSTLTDKASVLGWINLANGLPMLLLTVAGGSVADRYDKRRVLLLTQFVQGRFGRAHGACSSFPTGSPSGTSPPSRQCWASPPRSRCPPTPRSCRSWWRRRTSGVAIGLDRSLFHATRFLGPALAGVVIARLGAASAFFINALSFAVLVAAILTLAPRKLGSVEEEEQRAGGMKRRRRLPARRQADAVHDRSAGVDHVFHRAGVHRGATPLYVKDVLRLGPEKLGYLMAVSGVGSMLGGDFPARHPSGETSRPPALGGLERRAGDAGFRPGNELLGGGRLHGVHVGGRVFGFRRGPIPSCRSVRRISCGAGLSALAGLSFFGLIPFAGVGFSSLADAIGNAGRPLCSVASHSESPPRRSCSAPANGRVFLSTKRSKAVPAPLSPNRWREARYRSALPHQPLLGRSR